MSTDYKRPAQPDPGPPDQVWRMTITAIVVSPDDPSRANCGLDLCLGGDEWPHIVEVRADHLATATLLPPARRVPDEPHSLPDLADLVRRSMVLQMHAAGIEGGEE